MKKEHISDALNMLNDDIIEETNNVRTNAKPKRKWLLSDKQKAQMELYEAVSKERTVMCMMMMDSERHAGVAARVLGGEEHAPLQDAGAPPPYQRRHVHHQLRSVRGVCVRDRW